jgi:hypothetical protein
MADKLLNWALPPGPDVDMTVSDNSPSSAAVASLRPTLLGKFVGTGGGGGKLVNLVSVHRDTFCLGFIGTTKAKICLGPRDCDTKSHERERFSFPEDVQDLVFIDTGGSARAAWSSPSVELGWFGTTWDRYKDETRNVTQWQTLLEAMLASQSFTEQDVARMGEATRTTKGMFTPFKKKRRTDDSLSDDEQSALSYQDVEPMGYSPLRPGVGYSSQWSRIVQNLDWLKKMALAAKKGNEELEETLADVMMRLEARVGEVRAILGPRPAGLGTATVFGLVEAQDESIKDVEVLCSQTANDLIKIAGQYAAPDLIAWKETTKQEMYVDVSKALDPLRAFFGKFSTAMNRPGNRLDVEMTKLNQELARLGKLVQQQSAPPIESPLGSPVGLNWNYAPALTALIAPAPPPSQLPAGMVPTASPDFKALERKVRRLEQQLDLHLVKIGSVTFASRHEADSWLKTHCPTLPGAYTYFMDFHSLLALAFGPGGNMAEILKLQESSTKLSFATMEEGMVMASFHLEIPSFFGKATTTATTHSAKILPGLETYKAWDSGDGEHGLRYNLKYKVRSYADTWRQAAEFNLLPDALAIAQVFLHMATSFVDQVLYWILEFFTDCKNKGANDKETWKHISHTVREICNILHEARKAGQGQYSTAAERASGAFWGQIQAFREMEHLSQRSLVSDHRLSHILNLHLRDNAVMRSELNEVNENIRSLRRELVELKKANSKRTPAGAGRGAARTDDE